MVSSGSSYCSGNSQGVLSKHGRLVTCLLFSHCCIYKRHTCAFTCTDCSYNTVTGGLGAEKGSLGVRQRVLKLTITYTNLISLCVPTQRDKHSGADSLHTLTPCSLLFFLGLWTTVHLPLGHTHLSFITTSPVSWRCLSLLATVFWEWLESVV